MALNPVLFTQFDEAVVSTLYDLLGDDFLQLLETFRQDSSQHLSSLGPLIEAAQVEDLTRAAHSLKGISANVGALSFSELCRQIEFMARANDLAGCRQHLAGLQKQFEAVEQVIRECQ